MKLCKFGAAVAVADADADATATMPSPFRAAGVVELPYILAIAIALACWLQGTLNVELTAPPPPPPPSKRRSFLSARRKELDGGGGEAKRRSFLSSVVGRFRRQKSRSDALALGSLSSWSLAKTIPGDEFLRVYTQKSGSKLKLRFHGHTRAGAAHFLALMHEVDLMPSWNAFVPWASVLEGSSDHDELVALAHVNPPWPVPTHHVLVRARLDGPLLRAQRVADLVVSSPDDRDALRQRHASLDRAARERWELPCQHARLRLEQLPPSAEPGGARTSVEALVFVELKDLKFLGRAAALLSAPPQWIVNLVLGLVIPRIWSRYLEATKELDAGGGPYVARVTRDERGVYKRLKRAWRDIT